VDAVTFALLGLGLGGMNAMFAQSIVVVHRGSGVLNFAAGATGMFGAYIFFKLHGSGCPFALAMVLGLVAAAAIGALTHLLVMRWLVRAAMTTKIVATLALMSLLLGSASLLFAPQGEALAVPSFLPGGKVEIGEVVVATSRLVLAGIAIAVTLLLMLIERRTRIGLATSAVAENRMVASSMGWSPDVIAVATWSFGSALAGAAAMLIAPISGLDVSSISLLVIPALAAALVGNFESFPLTLLGAMIIGVGESEVGRYVSDPGWVTAAPLLVIVVVLVLRGGSIPSRSQMSERLTSVGPGRIGVGAAVGMLVGLAAIFLITPSWLEALTITFLMGLVVLSVVVVTGFAGQVSLAQLSLAGMGAFFVSLFTIKLGMPMWLAVVLGSLATVPVGAVFAVPALRTRGSNLAIATLALGSVIEALVLTDEKVAASLIGPEMPKFTVFGVSFSTIEHPVNFALLALGALAAGMLLVSNLRRGASGRRLLAVRVNERASAALGISVPGVKLFVFALGAFLAAAGGALLEAQLPFADYSTFTVLGSIQSVLEGVIGGLGWASGAPVGATAAEGAIGAKVVSLAVSPGNWLLVISGALALVVVLESPDGLVPLNLKRLERLGARLRRRRRSADPVVAGTGAALAVPAGAERRAPATVEVSGATVRFGGQVALDDVSVAVEPGTIVGLIGPNGAGKSTLIDVVSGFQPVAAGTVTVDGRNVSRLSAARRARLGFSRSFQSLELFEDMSILDNLRTAADPCPPSRYAKDLFYPRLGPLDSTTRAAIGAFDLDDVLDRRPSELDYARRRLVAVARALALNPTVLFLDEPAAGLDRAQREELVVAIRRLVDGWGIGVLLVEHDVDLVFSLCDRIVALDAGRVIARGSPEEVRNSEAVRTAYLGTVPDEGGATPGKVMQG
jgi:sulfate-transporting ATPase